MSPLIDDFVSGYQMNPANSFAAVLDEIESAIKQQEWSEKSLQEEYTRICSKAESTTDSLSSKEIAIALGAATIATNVDIPGVFAEACNQRSDFFNQYFTPPNVAAGVVDIARITRGFDRPRTTDVRQDTADQKETDQQQLSTFTSTHENTSSDTAGNPTPVSDDFTVVFDPACGSGRLLVAASRQLSDSVVLGWERDRTVARQSALTLALTGTTGWIVRGDVTRLEASTIWKITPGNENHRIIEATPESNDTFSSDYCSSPPPEIDESMVENLTNSSESETDDALADEIETILTRGVDMTLANPPFDSADIGEDATGIYGSYQDRSRFDLARREIGNHDSSLRSSVPYHWLMFELADEVTRADGAIVFIVPSSALDNRTEKKYRKWLLTNTFLHASISLPPSTFAPHTQTKTGILAAKPRTNEEREYKANYEVHMGVAENIGHDTQGDPITLTNESGDARIDAGLLPRTYETRNWVEQSPLTIPDDDIPLVVDWYQEQQTASQDTESKSQRPESMV